MLKDHVLRISELLYCATELSPEEFRRHGRKIIRLIEVTGFSSPTLSVSQNLVFSQKRLPVTHWKLREYHCICLRLVKRESGKSVYFDLLRMLQARHGDLDDTLKARTNSLLVRLSSNFVGGQSSVATMSLPGQISLPGKSRQLLAQDITTCAQPPAAMWITMPPPDAFPPSTAQSFRRRRQRLPFLVPEVTTRPRKRSRPIDERENQTPSPELASITYAYKPPRLTKKFGIFCTGKSSMHQHRPPRLRAY
ncbi:hypothetical protein MVEN_02606300 [Mycena venus]|uniref:Uncharacterized protein n=1 Tax=Mycena venus TaxID=2733690 RepID=A0A8H6U0L6_9AGAR|nr:hypothetical protein MVEN_02606300 [Mycena venus]